ISIDDWTNDTQPPLALTPNVLKEPGMAVSVFLSENRPQKLLIDPALLSDGDPAPPPQPWVEWTTINYTDSGWFDNMSIVIDTFNRQVRVNAITLVEDPNHPESWL